MRSVVTYILFIGVLCAMRLVLTVSGGSGSMPQAGQVNWMFILIFGSLGFAGLALSARTTIPDMWDPEVSSTSRFIVPAIVGLAFAALTICEGWISPAPRVAAPMVTRIAVFLFGAIIVEITLRLFLLSLFAWLICLFSRGNKAFWIAAVLIAFVEPLLFFADEGQLGASGTVVVAHLFIANLIAAYFFKRAGFLAPLTMRLTDYLLWHIAWQG